MMGNILPSYFHLHLISDSTGETLTTIAKAAAVQYAQVRPIEHVHPLIRNKKQLTRVLTEIEQMPGAEGAGTACLETHHVGVRILSRGAANPYCRWPARGRCRLFPAH
jgi:Kinase/pyrophosphorylase